MANCNILGINGSLKTAFIFHCCKYMKVLMAGAKGYIETRLIPILLGKGHTVVCLLRDKRRFSENKYFQENGHADHRIYSR